MMAAEEVVTTEAPAERESESFGEALPLYLEESDRVSLLPCPAGVGLEKASEAGSGGH